MLLSNELTGTIPELPVTMFNEQLNTTFLNKINHYFLLQFFAVTHIYKHLNISWRRLMNRKDLPKSKLYALREIHNAPWTN